MLVHFPYVLVIFVLVVSCSLLLILIRGRVVECACAILGVDNRPHQQLEKQEDKLIKVSSIGTIAPSLARGIFGVLCSEIFDSRFGFLGPPVLGHEHGTRPPHDPRCHLLLSRRRIAKNGWLLDGASNHTRLEATDTDTLNSPHSIQRLGIIMTAVSPLLFQGTLLNTQGTDIPNAKVQLWQTDFNGNYLHPNLGGGRCFQFTIFCQISNTSGQMPQTPTVASTF